MTDADITALLSRVSGGDAEAQEQLYAAVYGELRGIARGQRRRRGGLALSMDTTEVVHEAYLRLTGDSDRVFTDRGHFFAVATLAMKQLLLDRARRSLAKKRDGEKHAITFEDELVPAPYQQAEQMLALDRALESLGEEDPTLKKVVEYRFFAGMTEDEAGEVLNVSSRSVRRYWTKAKLWLRVHLQVDGDEKEVSAAT